MSRHKRNFHCFNAVGGEGSHTSSLPFEHHTPRQPRIPQRDIATYHELEQDCYLCSAHRHAQTAENQLLPLYHTHTPFHHHPQQYVLRGPNGFEETHSDNHCHIHQQRYNKKIVLVKNSDPSFRKTIILHSRGLCNFGLFLEEVSDLMQYHIRKLYTKDGCKVDGVQSLLQCPGVLICVGREPSHPLIMENFEKTSSCKLPKLSGKPSASERTDRNERLAAKTSIILPNLEGDKRATKYSVSSDKSAPDGRDSPDVISCSNSGESIREDDIEKRVRVNKDGSLSMEMKVRFRLPNDETLQWSTKVKKTAGQNADHIKGHTNPNLAQISDVSCSESEIMSADDAYFTQHYQGHKDKPHCPYCCSNCQGYETSKNVPETHGASRCSHTSSSSASSHTVVSRKTVIERQTMSRSSEELAEHVLETCITQSIEAAETVELCTVQRETCSPKCNVKPSTERNGESTGLYNLQLKTAHQADQEEQQAGSATCASQMFTGDEEKDDGNDGSFAQISDPDRKETTGSNVFDTELFIPHLSPVSKERTSKSSGRHTKPKTSKPSYICHCGEAADVQIKPKEKIKTKAGAEGELQRDKFSAKSVESDASCRSNQFEEIQKIERLEEGRRSTSAMSVNSNTPTNCNSAVSDVATEELQADHDEETAEGTSGRISVKSFKSSKSVETPPVQHESEEAEDDSEPRTQSSLSALSSVSAELKNIAQEASEEEDNQNAAEENGKDYEPRAKSTISEKSASRKSRASESATKENLMDNQVEWGSRPSSISATSRKSTVSPTSRISPRLEETSMRGTSALSTKSNVSTKSKESKTTKKANITQNDNTEGESELRSQSKLSVKSERSVKSNLSAKSSKSKTSQMAHNESCNEMKDDYCGITERPDSAEARASSVVSEKSVGSLSVTPTKPNACRDNMATKERAGSVISVKSSKSDTSEISLKSETSQVSATHNGDLCGERNELHATAGRSSCMSDKSMKSNISARSSNSKGCDKLDEDDALSLKSTQTTFSKTSAKPNPSQTSDATAQGYSADETEQRQRAPSNLSTASTKSSVSHASAGCAKEIAPEVCCNPSEGIFSEEEIEGRSVSSMSVQSVKSNISSRSSRSSYSTRPPAAEGTELFPQDSEEIQTEIRAASSTSAKSAELQKVRSASAMSATSTKSQISTKSNTSTMCSSIIPGEDAEEAIQERVPSVLSVKSTKSATSTKSTKSKCSIDALQQKHSKASNQEIDKELLQERPPSRGSPVSERSAKSAERPHSALSAKSKVSDAELVTAARPSDDRDYEDEAEPRAQSALSTKTANSTASAKSSKSTKHDSLYDNKSNHGEMVGRASSKMSARSEKSTKSNASTVSKRSKVAAGCLEGIYPEERVVEGESESRLMSPYSADSISSTKSNKSMHPAAGEVEDDSLASEGEKHEEHDEERSPSTMSAKSTQSCMSEISTKSAERTPSSLSAKSGKSSTTKICSGKCPGESNILEETETRAESALSCKTERSASSAKSTTSKGLDCRADESTVDDDKHVGRAPSNLSSKSEKSTKSNGSKGGKRLKVSKISLEHEAADPEEKAAENDREDKSFSPQSVRSKASVKSNKLKCCVDIAVAKNSDILDEENDTETDIERAASSMSTSSVQSSVSEMSFKSEERAASALSEKSHASMISDLTNVSEVPSGRAARLDEVDSEDDEGTLSVMSVKSTNSSISNKSSKSAKLDNEKQRERSSSNLSVKSGRSAKSNISKRSDVYDILSENSADNCDVRIVEGESEGSTISVVSAQSVKSQRERFGYDSLENEEHKRPPSSSSAKSVLSHVSEKSAKSADRPASASSAKSTKSRASAKSIRSEISDAKSGKTVEIYDEVTESHERTNSALSSKTAQSAISTKSSKVKYESPEEEGEHEDRNPSSMSVRSVKSAKSNVSKVSQKSKASAVTCEPSAKNGDEDECQEEDNESRSVSSMSIHSAKSDISARSGMSICSSDIPVQQIIARPDSPASTISIKSNSSGVFSDSNPTGERTDKKTSQGRSDSAMSAKSTFSAKSNKSKISAAPTDGSVRDHDQVARQKSNLSIKSTTSNVSGTSTKSKASNIPSEHKRDVAASDIEGGGNLSSTETIKSKVSDCSKNSRCSNGASAESIETPDEDDSEETMQDRVESCSSVKTGCSCASEKAIGSKHSYGRSNDVSSENVSNVTDDNAEEDTERKPLSPISAKSVKTNVSSVSTKSKASRSQRAKEEDQRTHSVLSIKSDTSSRTIKSNRSNITPLEGIGNYEDMNDSTLDAKPNKLIDPDILTEESEVHNDRDVSEKSEVEERAVSPASTKTDLSEALSRSEVPSVTIEETQDRSNTATPSKSKTSGRSKKSRTSEIQGAKRARKSESSLSVHSHLSVRSRKTNVTDVSTASVVCESTGEGVTPTEDRAPCLDEEVKEGPTDDKSSKTKRSRGQGTEDEGICPDKHPVICHKDSAESDLSQTLSCSDIMKEDCETSSPGESKSHVSKRIGKGPLEGTDSVSDHSDKSSKHKKNNMDAGDFELVPSILPNASPTEVVNEWLKTLPTERDLYEMEEINENGNGVKDDAAAEEADGSEGVDKNESKAENVKEVNCISNVHNDDCQQSTEAPNEDNTCTQREDGSKMLNSSIQVMKVLLNPKLDRCNSLPEISRVYGRKLSTSAKGLLDCLVKLQLIDYDPEIANEKNERYQQLMSILQSLWLSEPPEKEHIRNTNDHHSIEGEYNHTSSSGVDVNSGSTGSGKSSDGVKSSNDVNADGSQPQNSLIMIEKAHEETDAEWKLEVEEVNQEEDDRATDETIRSNDSPREAPETPSSSNKSSRGSSRDDKTHSGKQLQDPDPVWVLTLLNKIEKQFMTHYISAMTELKNRWSLKDTDQLDMMIEELKIDVHKKIQISIDREVRKIQGKVGLPRPPNEAIPRVSGKQTEQRRRKLKNKLQQSMDSQSEKSDSTGTSYSDQRGENIDEYCPCETCKEKNLNFRTTLSAQVKKTAPVVTDYDLKRILLMKTAMDWTAPCSNDNDTITAETLVEKVIVGAIKEVESNEVDKVRDKAFEFPVDETEESNASQDDQATIEETVKLSAVDNEEEIGKAGDKSPESETETTSPVEEKMSEVETASEDGTIDAPSGERGSKVNTETVSEDEDEEEVTEIMSSEHKYITASTKELPNQADNVPDDTVEVQSKGESEQEEQCVLVKDASSSKMEGDHEEARKDWLTLKRKLLPSVRIVLQAKTKKRAMMNDENNDTVTCNETVKDQTEEEESKARVAVLQETTVLSENESSEEAECGEAEDKEHEVSVKQTTDVKSNKEDEEEVEMDEDSLLEMTSNATLSEDENAATETSPTDTSEHGAEKDKIEEQTSVATLTDQKSDMEEAREGTDTTSDHDSVEDSGHTSDGDESQFEKEVTVNELSSIQEEEATEDELSVVSEAELKKKQMTAVGYAKENKGAESEVQTSEREEVDEESIAEKEETISPVNSADFLDENEAATAESSEEADEGATTNAMDVKKQVAVTGEKQSVNAASTDQESDDEKAEEAGQVDPRQETDAAEVLKASSATSEDEELETATSEHKPEKDAAEGEGAGSDEEKLSAVRANESADENRVSSTEDESSDEHNEGASIEDDISTDKKIVLTQNGESKDETAADGQHDEVSEEAATVDDGEETDTVGESDSAEDINGTTNDDGTAEESDAMSGELSTEHAENDTNDEQDGKETTATATSAHESDKSEVAEEEEAVDCKKRPVKVKNRNDQALTSEAEDGSEEDEINADTTEMESGKDSDGEATSRQGSGSEDETNEENEDKLKEKQSIEATDAEEEDMVKNKSDSAEGNEAFTNDETSVAETKHEINKACNESNEKVSEETGGEESDVSAENDPGSTIEGSSQPVSENESEEEGNGSAIDDEKSESGLRAGTDETTGQEDTSTVRGDDELGDNDSETQSDNEIVEETSREYSEENESLSQAESVEQCVSAKESKSSGKVKKSIDGFEEEKKGKDCDTSVVDALVEDETPLDESESVENESESESKGEDCSEAASKGHGDNKSTDEDLSETEMVGSEITQNDSGERSRSKDAGEGRDDGDKAEIEESADEAEDGSVEENEPQFTDDQDEDRDVAAAALSDMTLESQEKNNGILKRNSENSSFKDSEKDEDDTDTPHEGWSGSLGDSADGEDEAEEDSEPEEDTNDRQKPFVADKLGSLDATKRAPKKTLQIPLDALIKERAESEDGAYADIEDSETEIHGQQAGASLESKSLKKV